MTTSRDPRRVSTPSSLTAGQPDLAAWNRELNKTHAMAGMRARLARAGLPEAVPVFVDAEARPANPGGWPRGGTTVLKLPNRHLEYAVTWFGLAATLIGVFGAFAVARLRATGHNPVPTEVR